MATMNAQYQGPIIDALVLAGASREELDVLFLATQTPGPKALKSAREYLSRVQSLAHIYRDTDMVRGVNGGIQELGAVEADYQLAEERWRGSCASFPGWMAVSIGLSESP